MIVEKNDKGFLATDLKKTYFICNDKRELQGKETIWSHNQPWVVYESDQQLSFPDWFSIALYEQSKGIVSTRFPDQGDIKDILIEGDGFCYSAKVNGFTSVEWYANNALQCLIECLVNWTPINDVSIRPMSLLFDNGQSVFGGKPIQVWQHEQEHYLSFFSSEKDKALNIPEYSHEAIELLKYAADTKESKWRLNKKWKELLHFTGQISPFENFSETKIRHTTGHVTELIFTATAGKYFLIRFQWAGLFNGEGDYGEDYYLFDNEEEFTDKLNELIKHD